MFQKEINQLIESAHTSLRMAENLRAADVKASRVVDGLKPTGLDDCPYEDAMWHQENVKEYLESMALSDEDKACEYRSAMASFSSIVSIDQETPSSSIYNQAVFVSFDERQHHAYA
jgi:hypothetical protein